MTLWTALLAAVALRSSMAVDVPYLPQSEALCGGAAAAMVFRYWGDTHADVQQFAPLVDPSARGIADEVLVKAVRERGWRTERFVGSIDELGNRLAVGQPVIVLLVDRGSRYHYLVVTGLTDEHVIVHDPSWGPTRAIDRSRFLQLWQPARFWSLVILPSPGVIRSGQVIAPEVTETRDETSSDADRCSALLSVAIRDIHEHWQQQRQRASELAAAEKTLQTVRAQCPTSPGPLRELAGVRFAEQQWADASDFARRALERDRSDSYALDVLGSSLFMQNDPIGALRAWNQIGKPKLDLVGIRGVHHARYQAIAQALDLRPNTLLTADAFARATRRIGELPDQSTARLSVRPGGDGFASVDAVISERAVIPRSWPELTGDLVRAGIDREASLSLPGFTGEGEIWSTSWRWWSNRPRVALSFTTPRASSVFGIWRVEGSWEEQTYGGRAGDTRPLVRESRTHGGLTVSDWLTGNVRYSVNAGFDTWSTGVRAASIGGSLEHRWFADRASLTVDETAWVPTSNGLRFHAGGARAMVRSSSEPRGWVYQASVGAQHASDGAPLALWPGAGEGRAREQLLRAHPLLRDGVIDVTDHSIFGRSVTHATAEAQRWLSRPRLARVGIVGFVDAARASRRRAAGVVTQADVGFGLRLRSPGGGQIMRVDAAHGILDGANAVTVGWVVPIGARQ